MQLASKDDLGDRVDVVVETLMEQQSLRHLQIVQMLQQSLQLIFKDGMKLLGPFIFDIHFTKFFDAIYEKL